MEKHIYAQTGQSLPFRRKKKFLRSQSMDESEDSQQNLDLSLLVM